LVVLSCVIAGLCLDYFEYSVSATQNYKIGVWSLSYDTQVKDVSGRLYTSFANFNAFACGKSYDEDIEAICDSLLHIEVAGVVFIALSVVLIAGLLMSSLNLFMLVLISGNWAARTRFTHYLNPVLYFTACSVYLLVSEAGPIGTDNQLRADTGVTLMFVAASLLILTFTHYFYLWRFNSLKDLHLLTMSILARIASPSHSDPRPGILFSPKLSPKEGGTEQDKDAEIARLQDGISQLSAKLRKLEMDKQEAGLVRREMEVYRAKYENLRDSLKTTEGAVVLVEQIQRQDEEIIRLNRELTTAKETSPKNSEVMRENQTLKGMLSELRKSVDERREVFVDIKERSAADFSFRSAESPKSQVVSLVRGDKATQGANQADLSMSVGNASEIVLQAVEGVSEYSMEDEERESMGLKQKQRLGKKSQLLTDKQIELEILRSKLEVSRGSVTEAEVRKLEEEVLDIQGSSAALSPLERLKLEKRRELLQLKTSPVLNKANRTQLAIVKAQLEAIEASEAAGSVQEIQEMLESLQVYDESAESESPASKLVREHAASMLAEVIEIRKETSPEEIRHQKEQELRVLRAAYSHSPNSVLFKKVEDKQKELAMVLGGSEAERRDVGLSMELSCSISIPSALHSGRASEIFRSQSVVIETGQQFDHLADEVAVAVKHSDGTPDAVASLRLHFSQLISKARGTQAAPIILNKLKAKLEELQTEYREHPSPQLKSEIDLYKSLLDEASSDHKTNSETLVAEVEELRRVMYEHDEQYSREIDKAAQEAKAKDRLLQDSQGQLSEANEELFKIAEELGQLRVKMHDQDSELQKLKVRPQSRENFTQHLLVLQDTETQAVDEAAALVARTLQDKERELLRAREEAESEARNSQQSLERLQLQLDNSVRRVQYLESDKRTQALELQHLEAELTQAKDKHESLSAKLVELQQTEAQAPRRSFDDSLAREQEKFYEGKVVRLTEERREQAEELEAANIKYDLKERELKRIQDSFDELRTAKTVLDEELQALKEALKGADEGQRVSAGEVARLRVSQEAAESELKLSEERLRNMEALYTQTMTELTSKKGTEIERLRQVYEETHTLEVQELKQIYEQRLEKVQDSAAAQEAQAQLLEEEVGQLRTAGKQFEAALLKKTREAEKLDADVQALALKLAHMEAQEQENTRDIKELRDTKETLEADCLRLEERLRTQRDAYERAEREQEVSHTRERERLKDLLAKTHAQELEDVKTSVEARVTKVAAELEQERQTGAEAEARLAKLKRELKAVEHQRADLEAETSSLKISYEALKAKLAEAEQEWVGTRTSLTLQLQGTEQELEAIREAFAADKQSSRLVLQQKSSELVAAGRLVQAKEEEVRQLEAKVHEIEGQSDISDTLRSDLSTLRAALTEKDQALSEAQEALQTAQYNLQEQNLSLETAEIRQKTAESRAETAAQRLIGLEESVRTLDSQRQDLDTQRRIAQERINQLEELLKRSEAGNLSTNAEEQTRMKQELEEGFVKELEGLKGDYDKRILILNRELSEYRDSNLKASSTIGEMQVQRSELAHKATLLEEELNHAQFSIKSLEATLEELRLKDTERDQEELRRSQLSDSPPRRLPDASFTVRILNEKVSSLSHSLSEREKQLQRILKERDDLRAELESKVQELDSVTSDCIGLQRQLHESPSSLSRVDRQSPGVARHSAYSDNESEDSGHSAQEMVVLDNMSDSTPSHPLLEKVQSLKKESPMTYSNVWKLFEALMQEKNKLDRLEISLRRQPRTMSEFMLDFLYMHYGLKTLALKQLKALIASLEDLYRQGHPYGVLFCRFLGLFHPRPLAPHLSIYMVFIQEQFQLLCQKNKLRKPENFAQQYELLQYGGQASVIDVMELVVKLCRHNRTAGERIIAQLLPDNNANRLELILLKVCGTIARLGKDPRAIFELMDRDQGGTLDYTEFTEGLRHALNVWVSQDEAEDLCAYLDDGSGEISYFSWCSKISFAEYLDKAYTREAMITKADFLNSLIDEYEFEVVQDFYNLRQLVPSSELDVLMFFAVLQDIDPTVDEDYAQQLWQEAQAVEHHDVVSSDSACIVMLKHQVGGYGVGMFDLSALDRTLPKTATEGVNTDIVVERDTSGELRVDIRKKENR
jgi:chromosome segregation ATPase